MVDIEGGTDAFGGIEMRKIQEVGGCQMELNVIKRLGKNRWNKKQLCNIVQTALMDEMLLLFEVFWLSFRCKAGGYCYCCCCCVEKKYGGWRMKYGCCDDSCALFLIGTRRSL